MSDAHIRRTFWLAKGKPGKSIPGRPLAPFTRSGLYNAKMELMLLKATEEGINCKYTEFIRRSVEGDVRELYVDSTAFRDVNRMSPLTMARNIKKLYGDATNVLLCEGAQHVLILLSAVMTTTPEDWLSQPEDYDEHMSVAGVIFAYRLGQTQADRNRYPTLAWRKEILMYLAGALAACDQLEAACGTKSARNIRKRMVREAMHMLLVQSAVTVAEYMLSTAARG